MCCDVWGLSMLPVWEVHTYITDVVTHVRTDPMVPRAAWIVFNGAVPR